MKSLFTAAVLLVTALHVNSQTVGDLVGGIKGKKKTEESSSATPVVTVDPGANQFDMIEAFLSNKGKLYQAVENGASYRYAGEKLDYIIRDIKRNEKNQVISFSSSIGVNSEFKIEEGEWPRFFRGKNGGALYFNANYAIYCDEGNLISTPEQAESQRKFGLDGIVYGFDKEMIYGITADKHVDLLVAHLTEVNKGTQKIADQKKAEGDKAEAEKRAKFTTKDKAVVSISLSTPVKTFKQGETQKYDIVINLKDGSTLSTATGAYHDEFEIEVSGLPATYKSSFGDMKTVGNGTITIPDNAVVNGDQVTIKIKSKFHPTVTSTSTFVMDYSQTWTLDYNGQSQSTACHQMIPGAVRVELKGVKHGVTKADLIEFKLYSIKSGSLLKHFRVNPTTAINLWLNGAKGWTGTPGESCSRAPKDGSAGGDVTLIVDPSVKSYMLNISNKGGASGGTYSSPGRDGKVEKLNQAVAW